MSPAMLSLTFALSALGCYADSKLPALRSTGVTNSKLLALRGGGVSTDQVINAQAAILIGTGAQGWLAPKTQMASFTDADLSEQEITFARVNAGINAVSGVTLLASDSDSTAVCLLAWAIAISANVPMFEKMGAAKPPFVGFIAMSGILGELARQGKVNADIARGILLALLIPVSLMEIVSPDANLKAFNIPEPSALSKSLMENFSWTKMSTGMFLLVGKLTGNRGLGFAASAATGVLNCAKTITRADKAGLKKPGLIAFTVLQGALGLLALKNEKK